MKIAHSLARAARSLLLYLVLPWLAVGTFYALAIGFFFASGLYERIGALFLGIVGVWVFAWWMFLMVCAADAPHVRAAAVARESSPAASAGSGA